MAECGGRAGAGGGVRFGKRSFGYVRVSRGGTHACGSTQVRARGRGAQGSQGGEMPEKKTVRRQNGAFRIFARILRTRATLRTPSRDPILSR